MRVFLHPVPEAVLEQAQSSEVTLGRLNLFLSLCGLFLFAIGSYLSLQPAQSAFLLPGQYLFAGGILLSFVGIISIFRRHDF